jgi:hypothetical protein
MRLNSLLQPTSNDIILKEAIKAAKSPEYLTELLPALVVGAGMAWTAYDAYQAKKAYDTGEITKDQLIKRIGTDAALTFLGGGAAKLAVKGVNKFRKRNNINTQINKHIKKKGPDYDPIDGSLKSGDVNDLLPKIPINKILTKVKGVDLESINEEREYITEFLPLIPLALWGAGAAWTAYDAYQTKKAYDRGDIDKGDLVRIVGTDIAITLAAGGVGKVVGKGWKYGKKIYKSKKAAKTAEKAAVTSAAVAVNKTVKSQVADVMPHSQAAVATTTSKVADAVSPAAAVIVKGAKKVDDVVDKVSSKAPEIVQKLKYKYKSAMPHSTAAVAPAVAPVVTKAVKQKLTKAQRKALSDMPAVAPVVTKAVKKKLTKAQKKALSDMPSATAAVSAKAAVKAAKKNAAELKNKNIAPASSLAAKAGTKVIKKKVGRKIDKKKGKKMRWGLGGGVGSMHDTNFAQFVDKYATLKRK